MKKSIYAQFLPICTWLTILLPILMVTGPAPADIAVSAIAILFMLHSAHKENWEWLKVRWVQWLFALWAVMTLRNYFLHDGMDQFLLSLSWVRFPVFVSALTTWILRSDITRTRLGQALQIAVLLLVADTFYQYFQHTDIVGRAVMLHNRLTGPFTNPRVGITITWLAFPAIIAWLTQRGIVKGEQSLLIGCLLTAATIALVYITGERMAFLLMLCGMALLPVLHTKVRYVIPMVALMAFAGAIALSQHNTGLAERQVGATRSDVGNFQQTVYGQAWLTSIHIGMNHPFTGVGGKQYQAECSQRTYGPTDKWSLTMRCPMHSHNHYLELLAEYGLLGLVLFLGFLYEWYRLLYQYRDKLLKNGMAIGLFIGTALWLWPLSVTSSQFVPWAAIPFWLFVGWLTVFCTPPARAKR